MATITLEQGETTDIPLDLNEDDGSPYDLTDKRVSFAVSTRAGSDPILTKTSDDSDEVDLDAPLSLGTGTVHIVPADYTTLVPGVYAYSVWVDVGGVETHMAAGKLIVQATVARE